MCPVMERITVGGTRVQFSAKTMAPAALWDTKSGRAQGKSQTAARVNAALDKAGVAINTRCNELLAKTDGVTALQLKNAYQGILPDQEMLVRHFEEYNAALAARVGHGRARATALQNDYALGHLRRFLRKKYNLADIPFRNLTAAFIDDFDH